MARRTTSDSRQLSLFSGADGPSLDVVAHADPFVLERELIERVSAARDGDPFRPVIVLVPTRILAGHLRRRLAEHRRAWLGVETLPFRAAVRRAHAALGADGPALRPLPDRVLEAVLETVRGRLPANPLMEFTRRRAGGLRGLFRSIRELREATIPAADLSSAASTPRERALAEIYSAYESELSRLAERGLGDEAGWIAEALPGAELLASRAAAVVLHGAYELVGMHLDLVRAMARRAPTTILLPLQPGAPAGAYGEAFARRHLTGGEPPPALGAEGRGGLLGARLGALYDETAIPPRSDGGVVVRHVQGAAAEVSVALRQALRAVESDVPPTEIALIARSLEPYAPELEEQMAEMEARLGDPERAACFTTLESPLRRAPLAHDLLVLLRALDEDFPRATTVELLRSPRIRWEKVTGGRRPPGDASETWSRRAGIIGGIREWSGELRDWAGRQPGGEELAERVARVGDALVSLRDRVDPARARGWSDHAALLEVLVLELLGGEGQPAADALVGLADELRDLVHSPGGAGLVPFSRMRRTFERAVDETRLPGQPGDTGGIRVLDAMQARGLTFRRVFLLGLQSTAFPRVPSEDPFLGDGLRRRLRERTGKPLAVKLEGQREERLLLSLLLGAAGERLDVSWQRADDSGRALAPSLALRELARLTRGTADMQAVLQDAARVSSHPLARLREMSDDPGLLSPEDEDLLIALSGSDPRRAIPTLAGRNPDLGPSLRLVAATEDFPRPGGAAVDLSYDGVVAAEGGPATPRSVTAFQRLTACPLRFWFADVLRVRELEEEASVYALAAVEMGRRIHRLLERLYGELWQAGSFESDDPDRLVTAALEGLQRAWEAEMADVERRRASRLAALWALQADDWRQALRAFVARDLARIHAEGLRPSGLEEERSARLDLGGGARVELAARFDRVLRDGSGAVVVGDYKTSLRLARLAEPKRMLRGLDIQVGLYQLLAGDSSRVELLGVHPGLDYDSDRPDPPVRIEFAGFREPSSAVRSGFLETLRESLALASRGEFLLNPSDETCRFCAYRGACRPTHVPTLERRAASAGARMLDAIRAKTEERPRVERGA